MQGEDGSSAGELLTITERLSDAKSSLAGLRVAQAQGKTDPTGAAELEQAKSDQLAAQAELAKAQTAASDGRPTPTDVASALAAGGQSALRALPHA